MPRNKSGFESLVPGWQDMTDDEIIDALAAQGRGEKPPAPAATEQPPAAAYSVAGLPELPAEFRKPASPQPDAPDPDWEELIVLDDLAIDKAVWDVVRGLGIPASVAPFDVLHKRVCRLARRAVRDGVAAKLFVNHQTGKTYELVLTRDRVAVS